MWFKLIAALGYGVILDVSRGITRLAATLTPISIESVLKLAHLPISLKKNAAHLKKYGLTRIAMFEYDFVRQRFHMFVMIREPSCVDRDEYRRLLSDLQLMPVSDDILNQCSCAHVVSFAFDWKSERVAHASFTSLHRNIRQAPAYFDPLLASAQQSQVFYPAGHQAIFNINIFEATVSYAMDSDFEGAMSSEILKATQAGV
ncbi:MAG: hypothetical protein JXX14_05390 [Deltaproteobacteria bacterium]|nr:hypothetical protein [Deltaproteobacteria bacterium]